VNLYKAGVVVVVVLDVEGEETVPVGEADAMAL